MLVYPGQDVAGGVGQKRRVGRPGIHGRAVAKGAGGERNGAAELGERSQAGRGQRAGGAVKGASGRLGHAQGGRGVHVAVYLADAEGGLISVQGAERPGGVVGRGIGDDDAVVVTSGSAGQGRQAHRLVGCRARGRDQGVRHALAGQRGLPGRRRDVGRPLPDQQDPEVQGRRRRGRGRGSGAGRGGHAARS